MAALKSKNIQINLRYGNNRSTISVPPGCSVSYLRSMVPGSRSLTYYNDATKCHRCVHVALICYGKAMDPSRNISDYGLIDNNNLVTVVSKAVGGGLANVWYENAALQVGGHRQRQNYAKIAEFSISVFHVSCRSDKITGQNMIGIVLYLCDNKQLFYLNGMKCRSGYILLVSANKLAKIQTKQGTMHSKAFKYFVGKDLRDMDIVGGGFAIKNGNPVFRSFTFNTATAKFHDGMKEMHKCEQQCITAAIENWKKNVQNTKVSQLAANGMCFHHGFY